MSNCESCMPGGGDRERMVADKVREEDEREAQATHDARELIGQLLKDKGYSGEEIEVAPTFSVASGGHTEDVTVDYIVKLKGRRFIAIKCTMALESRERHIVSFSRVVDDHVIPYAAVTDGLKIHLLNAATGKTIAETSCVEAFPSHEDAMEEFERTEFQTYPSERLEKERRVLLAFECVTCPKPKD